ncbi:hypothetical protein TARUN_1155 [Trichoderma arundinaceum]|uniref:Uncharacterized protein n=1 Tax=Trichoderma arundinaceum TaxID=490622 RepID=A0A395NY93_TRIAR|nr:hypothetical protein TARUN_1155 [Trichoderma arundinaceum]
MPSTTTNIIATDTMEKDTMERVTMEKLERPNNKPTEEGCTNKQEVIEDFFKSIAQRQGDAAMDLIAKGLVSSDTPSNRGETPLIAAVRVNDAAMVRMLVAQGASIDGYGLYSQENYQSPLQRTPLQVAAKEGKLGIVKILLELGADDSLVAPDGAMALRLAAENGHQEVVDHLPTRRGGAWKRWKVTHEKQMRRVRRILEKIGSVLKWIFWTVPKFLVWTIPKHIFSTVPKQIWQGRHKIGPWCKRQIYKIPNRVKKAADLSRRGAKKAVNVIQKTPGKVWQIMKRIPGALWTIISWMGKGLGKLGNAILNILKRVASFIHTTIGAVVHFFQAITLQDVANGFRAILQAIFIDFPKVIAWFFISFGKTSYEALVSVFGTLGKAVFYLVGLILLLIRWFPEKIWEIMVACGISIGKGIEEVLVWINPKRM